MMLFFRTRGQGSVHTYQLQNFAVFRQVHHLLMSFEYFYQITCKVLWLSLLHKNQNHYFHNYEYDYVVGNGTMDCVDMVEVPLQGLYPSRIKQQMSPVILVP
jgi:hypothetical protein